ncbi:protein of unknown function [Chitinophaga terrae (ex Kim and Jung 2007)]|uniref:DUF4468 domain-containing protein n=1 Tax=Chitinophaga terrae (ex Kim and Jung 2007) TaxID=408074 RepID=A0A1H3WUU6_9BACT|nr:DUF4468 domain-containing protein [Chitinophaga terrae (ex Kim and Jung 2007)]MDQ0107051.1 hypothetical protein [Chitinophaga terrae (ex Kim and Jung 2007)]GEP90297.1 hypothetical protein CTE07_19420 [Chitinophaga terrae (ex Kim and Jung 2007)]SDZ90893.1 protein of unknown function [Chitinophaga terrae (ex Kim and Jung 2007)]
MKKLLAVLLLMLSIETYAQDSLYHIFPAKDGKVYYDTIVHVNSIPASQLFTRAQVWAISNFRPTLPASQVMDREGGIIAFSSYFDLPMDAPMAFGTSSTDYRKIWITMQIYVRNGKARVIICDAAIEGNIYEPDSGYRKNNGLIWKLETFNEFSRRQRLSGREIAANMDYFRKVHGSFKNLLSFASAALSDRSAAEF